MGAVSFKYSLGIGTNTHIKINGALMPKNMISAAVKDGKIYVVRGENEKIIDGAEPGEIQDVDHGGSTAFGAASTVEVKFTALLQMPAAV